MDDNFNFMRDKPGKQEPWNPSKWQCTHCEDIIFSKRPGDFTNCKCGKCFVDQTRYYMRMSQGLVLVAEGTYDEQ